MSFQSKAERGQALVSTSAPPGRGRRYGHSGLSCGMGSVTQTVTRSFSGLTTGLVEMESLAAGNSMSFVKGAHAKGNSNTLTWKVMYVLIHNAAAAYIVMDQDTWKCM